MNHQRCFSTEARS